MKKIISMLLCCAMLGTLCACQHGGDLEKRTPVPQFDIMASYSFDDAELKNDDGVSYYRQSLGSAEISSKDERTAQRINASLAELYVKFRADAEYTRRVSRTSALRSCTALYRMGLRTRRVPHHLNTSCCPHR